MRELLTRLGSAPPSWCIALAIFACTVGPVVGQQTNGRAAERTTSVGPVVEIRPESGGISRVVVKVDSGNGDLSVDSFQGQVAFSVEKLSVLEVLFPVGTTGVSNPDLEGKVRFAAISPDGAEGGVLLTLRVRSPAALRPADFDVELEEITTGGSRIP